MLRSPVRRDGAAARQRGASLIELMVGMTVGLIVVAGTLSIYAGQVGEGRRLLLEARLNQDLRAAADLISRDLRRAGYWSNAINGTIAIGTGSATSVNPYRIVTNDSDDEVSYQFSRDETENDAVDVNEQFGFRLAAGVMQMQTTEGNWQPMTDANLVTVTQFKVTPIETSLPLGFLCSNLCAVGEPNCPTVRVMRYDIILTGQSASDSRVVRTLTSTVRARNDRMEGQCPI